MRTLPHGIRDCWVFLVPGGSLCAQSWRPYYIVLCKKHNKIFLALNFYRLQNDIFIPPKMCFFFTLHCTSNRRYASIFWNNSFREKQENRDGLAKAAPWDAGMVSSGWQIIQTLNKNNRSKVSEMHFGVNFSAQNLPGWHELTYMGILPKAAGMPRDVVFISVKQIEAEPHRALWGAGQ